MRLPTFFTNSALLALVVAAALIAAGCGSDDKKSDGGTNMKAGDSQKLVVYSGRERELAEPLYTAFEKDTGIMLEVRYAESPQMAAQLKEEGSATPADVFYSQDAGAIGAVASLLEKLPKDVTDRVDERFSDNEGHWIGVTGRARTLVYNTESVTKTDLPSKVTDVTGVTWKAKVGVAPTNSSFIGFVSAMREDVGDAATLDFLKGLKANGAKTYEKNSQIVEAVAAGEISAGLVNHYYLYEVLAEKPDAKIANHFFADGDAGNFVNVSAVGILDGAKNHAAALTFVNYLLNEGQEFIVNDAEEREYPLTTTTDLESNPRYSELPALDSIIGPEISLAELGNSLESTVELIQKSGLTN